MRCSGAGALGAQQRRSPLALPPLTGLFCGPRRQRCCPLCGALLPPLPGPLLQETVVRSAGALREQGRGGVYTCCMHIGEQGLKRRAHRAHPRSLHTQGAPPPLAAPAAAWRAPAARRPPPPAACSLPGLQRAGRVVPGGRGPALHCPHCASRQGRCVVVGGWQGRSTTSPRISVGGSCWLRCCSPPRLAGAGPRQPAAVRHHSCINRAPAGQVSA